MSEPVYTVKNENFGHVMGAVFDKVNEGLKGGDVVVTLGREKRTPAQNRHMWAILRDVSTQVEWYGNKLCEEDWKHIFTAAKEKQRAVPGLEGGMVVLGVPTKDKDKAWHSDLAEIIYAFGAENGVKWNNPALQAFDYYREAQNIQSKSEG